MTIKEELLERYLNTGKIGFLKPKSLEEAYSIIDVVSEMYEEDNKCEEVITISLHDIAEKMRNFFTDF